MPIEKVHYLIKHVYSPQIPQFPMDEVIPQSNDQYAYTWLHDCITMWQRFFSHTGRTKKVSTATMHACKLSSTQPYKSTPADELAGGKNTTRIPLCYSLQLEQSSYRGTILQFLLRYLMAVMSAPCTHARESH